MKIYKILSSSQGKTSGSLILTAFSLLLAATFIFSSSSCSSSAPKSQDDYLSLIHTMASPYTFDFTAFEVQKISGIIDKYLWGTEPAGLQTILTDQISSVLAEHHIQIFPPINLVVEECPHILIISPRDKILYLNRIMLRQDMTVADMEKLESQIEKLGYSALVEELGGFAGTYPPIVSKTNDIKFNINASVEEWLHQYLAFHPLGSLYVLDSLGLTQDPDVITMNETLAGIVSQEIGDEVYQKYYASASSNQTGASAKTTSTGNFDFNTEMRKTREQTDAYLAKGDVTGAEAYMESRRLVFVANGYNIRKLNQAYFAFHGIYAYDPASASPIYTQMQQLRSKSPSLTDFLKEVSSMSSYSELKNALQNTSVNLK